MTTVHQPGSLPSETTMDAYVSKVFEAAGWEHQSLTYGGQALAMAVPA